MINIDSMEKIENAIAENPMVLLYFGGESCNVCVSAKPKVNDILKKYPNIKSFYIDMEKYIGIASKYSIFTMPAVILYIEGKETIREARHMSLKEIDSKINRYYYMIFEN